MLFLQYATLGTFVPPIFFFDYRPRLLIELDEIGYGSFYQHNGNQRISVFFHVSDNFESIFLVKRNHEISIEYAT